MEIIRAANREEEEKGETKIGKVVRTAREAEEDQVEEEELPPPKQL